jgi:hypothetical protein
MSFLFGSKSQSGNQKGKKDSKSSSSSSQAKSTQATSQNRSNSISLGTNQGFLQASALQSSQQIPPSFPSSSSRGNLPSLDNNSMNVFPVNSVNNVPYSFHTVYSSLNSSYTNMTDHSAALSPSVPPPPPAPDMVIDENLLFADLDYNPLYDVYWDALDAPEENYLDIVPPNYPLYNQVSNIVPSSSQLPRSQLSPPSETYYSESEQSSRPSSYRY